MSKNEEKKEIKGVERRTTGYHGKSNIINYELPCFPKDIKEVVDMDAFQPINEAIKQLTGKRELTGDEVKQYYDFASGHDKGASIPFNRSAENLDLAMLTEHIRTEQNKIKTEIDEKQQEAKWRAEIEAKHTTTTQETTNGE